MTAAPLLELLQREDAITLSPPGFGVPAPAFFGATVDGYREWLIACLEQFREPVDLVGHDWGGAHVVQVAMARPDLIRSWASDVLGLFAEHGYEHVAVADVAREAEVSEQTVYNYFPSKEQLVTDREEQIQDRLCDLIRSRPPGVTAAAAIRGFVLDFTDGIRAIPPEQWHGEQ